MEELKPCPFCGGKRIKRGQALVQIGPYNNVFECSDCGMHFQPLAATWNECIKLWNRRTDLCEAHKKYVT